MEATSNSNPSTLQSSLDELATRVVLYGIDESVATALRDLSQTAQASGLFETATEAYLLAAQCGPSETASEASRQATFRQGLSRLAEVLHRENRTSDCETVRTSALIPAHCLPADPELIADFVTESREHLVSVEAQLLVLEQNPGSEDALHSIFRAFHTIKGLAGFLDFPLVLQVAHEVETLLDLARKQQIAVTSRLIDAVFEAADHLKSSITGIEAHAAGRPTPALDNPRALLQRIQDTACGATGIAAGQSEAAQEQPKEVQQQSTVASKPEGAAEEHRPFSVRVDTHKLERLMDAVGELLVAQSTIRQKLEAMDGHDPTASVLLARLARITADVQRGAMSMRMVPVEQLFGRSARVIRDLSRKLGKQARYESRGENIEVDKTIAEALSDPLLHMVRNAIDHGIEMPGERRIAGKDPIACVRLAAYQKGAEIVIEIADDGRGLDREKILEKAVEKGLVAPGVDLTDGEVFALIFEPGFSTASQVTDLSGRGVGMDVVRQNIAKLRGRIDIESSPGKGSTFFLRMPLTLAIIEGLVVGVGDQQFIVPMFAVTEVVRIVPEMLSTFRGRHEMALLRGELLPVVRLADKLGLPARSRTSTQGLFVITECDGRSFAVWIDELIGSQDLVIKSLSENLKYIECMSGCAVLGDGRVGLILDMAAICRGKQ